MAEAVRQLFEANKAKQNAEKAAKTAEQRKRNRHAEMVIAPPAPNHGGPVDEDDMVDVPGNDDDERIAAGEFIGTFGARKCVADGTDYQKRSFVAAVGQGMLTVLQRHMHPNVATRGEISRSLHLLADRTYTRDPASNKITISMPRRPNLPRKAMDMTNPILRLLNWSDQPGNRVFADAMRSFIILRAKPNPSKADCDECRRMLSTFVQHSPPLDILNEQLKVRVLVLSIVYISLFFTQLESYFPFSTTPEMFSKSRRFTIT